MSSPGAVFVVELDTKATSTFHHRDRPGAFVFCLSSTTVMRAFGVANKRLGNLLVKRPVSRSFTVSARVNMANKGSGAWGAWQAETPQFTKLVVSSMKKL